MRLKDLPPINFATADPDELESSVMSLVEEILGRKIERADPLRLLIKSLLAVIIQQRLLIDETAKQNLLAYAKGDYLDQIGALIGCERLAASKAVTTVEIELSTAREKATVIRAGTRITADDKIYFALTEDVIFLSGETIRQAKAICTVDGEDGNKYAAGEINKIVDPQAFLKNIVNVTTSEGGADIEDDDAYRERIHEAPEAFSCAGSEGAYIYHTKAVSQLISDVAVDSSEAVHVEIYPLMKGGELPGEEILSAIDEYLNVRVRRPLTDLVTVSVPRVSEYELNVSYWACRSDAVQAAAIDEAAQAAVQDYIDWQRAKLGRDINPNELTKRLMNIGVKRAEITSPQFTVLDKFSVAIPSAVNARFEGLEDD